MKITGESYISTAVATHFAIGLIGYVIAMRLKNKDKALLYAVLCAFSTTIINPKKH